MTNKSQPRYECGYCKKTFAKESTLVHHLCETKRRFQQENEVGVQWGYRAYRIFNDLSKTATKEKTYQDFVGSAYYTAFVRFGRYCHEVKCINYEDYCLWLLRSNEKLDRWCRDSLYTKWLIEYMRRENINDALERGVRTMHDYATEHQELKNGFKDYFRYANENRICHNIARGYISPWVIFNCDSGQDFLSRLNEDQLGMIMMYIDPDYWQKKFHQYPEDAAFARSVLEKSGL